jgi:hypothetical protein
VFEHLAAAGLGDRLLAAAVNLYSRLPAAADPGTTEVDPDNMEPIGPGKFNVDNGLTAGIGRIIGFGAWIVLILCVAGVLLCAAQMAIARKNGGEAAVIGLVWALAACIIAGSASAIVGIVV